MAGIFRAYDIRGVYGKDLDEALMTKIAFAYANYMMDHKFLKKGDELPLGADLRVSSPSLKKAFIQGALAAGLKIVDIGTISTPHAYFTVAHYPYKGGAMITASHNPKEFNGVKLMKSGGECLSGEDGIYDIEARVAKLKEVPKLPAGPPAVVKKIVFDDYEDWVAGKVKLAKPLRVIIDCGNGATSGFATSLLTRVGCKVTELYCKPDGTFPNHEPDPIRDEYIKDLLQKVAEAKKTGNPYDLGIAFDGDGDRVIFVDENGNSLRGDEAFALLGAHEAWLEAGKFPNNRPDSGVRRKPAFITEVVATRGPIRYLETHGGTVKMVRVGHSYIYNELKNEDALLAGEYSGHLFYRDNFGVDDAMFGAVKMCELVALKGSLAKQRAEIPKFIATPAMRPHVPDKDKFAITDKIVKSLQKKYGDKAVTIDGVRLELPKAWGLLRPSNTGSEFVIRFEGETQKDLDGIIKIFQDELTPYGITLDLKNAS